MDVVDSPHKGRPPSSTGLNHDVPRRRRRIPGRGAQNCAQPAALGAGGVVMFVQDRPRINGSAWPCAELRTTGGGNLCRHAHRCSIALVLGTVSVTGTDDRTFRRQSSQPQGPSPRQALELDHGTRDTPAVPPRPLALLRPLSATPHKALLGPGGKGSHIHTVAGAKITLISMPTEDGIDEARTANGGWTKDQLAEWGVSWPPPRGRKEGLVEESKGLEHEK